MRIRQIGEVVEIVSYKGVVDKAIGNIIKNCSMVASTRASHVSHLSSS